MKNKCKFVGIMFLCILIVCTLAVMAYEHTAGMKGAAGEHQMLRAIQKILTKLMICLLS